VKVVILAGGLGTRLAEETATIPKPMVEIGGKPILWHIMSIYATHGLTEFIIALGYKGDIIKRYFFEYQLLRGSITLDLESGRLDAHSGKTENWRIHLAETGLETMTGGRLLRLREMLGDETFMLTYGDGVADINIEALLAFHRNHGRVGTITAVRPPARFGGLNLSQDGEITEFIEKPQIGEGWINGGFMVLEPTIFDWISGDAASLESDVLEPLAEIRQLMAYRHPSFWQCMDTLREKRLLEQLWDSGQAKWKIWQ
jgi:glucose-1-phosphate cytidylyltransferase